MHIETAAEDRKGTTGTATTMAAVCAAVVLSAAIFAMPGCTSDHEAASNPTPAASASNAEQATKQNAENVADDSAAGSDATADATGGATGNATGDATADAGAGEAGETDAATATASTAANSDSAEREKTEADSTEAAAGKTSKHESENTATKSAAKKTNAKTDSKSTAKKTGATSNAKKSQAAKAKKKWVAATYKTVHHDEVGHYETQTTKVKKVRCNCDKLFDTAAEWKAHQTAYIEHMRKTVDPNFTCQGEHLSHYVTVEESKEVYVVDHEAYDEKVLVSEGHWE